MATDLRVPLSIVFTPDGRLLFAERLGRVRVIKDGKLEPEPSLTLPDVDNSGKLGLMGMTLHPEFKQNHWFYLAYAYKEGAGQRVRVVRYQETSQTLSERKVIIEDIPAATNHAGCRLNGSIPWPEKHCGTTMMVQCQETTRLKLCRIIGQ